MTDRSDPMISRRFFMALAAGAAAAGCLPRGFPRQPNRDLGPWEYEYEWFLITDVGLNSIEMAPYSQKLAASFPTYIQQRCGDFQPGDVISVIPNGCHARIGIQDGDLIENRMTGDAD